MKNCSVFRCRLGRLLLVLQFVLALMFVLLPSVLSAVELESLRLFYDPKMAVEDESQSGESILDVSVDANNSNVVQKTSSPSNYTVYHYNGFLRHEQSYRIYVNGKNLEEHTSIRLLSVDDSGRTLKLRTRQGRLFVLSLGETKRVKNSYQRVNDQ